MAAFKFLLLTTVTSKETHSVIIALHQMGFAGKDIDACKIAPQSSIYQYHQVKRVA